MLSRAELRTRIYNYVTEKAQRLEVFTDYTICSASDYDDCKEELSRLLDDMNTDDMRKMVDRIEDAEALPFNYNSYYEVFFGTKPKIKTNVRILIKSISDKEYENLEYWFDKMGIEYEEL